MEKIIDKVKKLIALGTNAGATEGERENAIRMAHALLAKHNLSMVDVDSANVGEKREKQTAEYQSVPWTGIIAMAMASLFFCAVVRERGKKDTFHYIGKTSNVVTAMLMADYLIKSINKQQAAGNFSRSFNNGAANKIYGRVVEMIKPTEVENSTCTDLAVISIYKSEKEANDKMATEIFKKLVKKPIRQVNKDAAAYIQGAAFGGKVSLNSQVNDQSKADNKLKIA